MYRRVFAVMGIMLCLCLCVGAVSAAGGPGKPEIRRDLTDQRAGMDEDPIVLAADAVSPDGGTLKYQWYGSDTPDMPSIRAIDGAVDAVFQPEKRVDGPYRYYCYGVWNTIDGAESEPVYSRLVRVEYYESVPEYEVMVEQAPDKTEYVSGECLDLTGLVVRVLTPEGYILFSDGKYDGLEIVKNPLVTPGEQKIRVGYKDAMDIFIVTVKEAPHVHKFGEWMVLTKPTCTENGIKARECDCGVTEREAIPATGHQWDSGKVTREPTETREGEKTFTCTVCGATRTEAIPMLEAKPTDPADTKPVETKPADTKPVETKPAETTPSGETAPSEDNTRPAEEQQKLLPVTIALVCTAVLVIAAAVIAFLLARKAKKTEE